jgi:hypothetical protein
MNVKLWRIVERFCRAGQLDPAAFDAFAQLVEDDQEGAVRKKVSSWSDEELEQLSLLISGTLDTVEHPRDRDSILQCQGLYMTGSESSLSALGRQEIPNEVRRGMAESLKESLPDQTLIIIGSRIVPATWVHGFGWKQWRAGLARDDAMFSRPCRAQPRQALESQAWILPVFVEKRHFLADPETDVSAAGVSGLGIELADALAACFRSINGSVPSDISIHPILAAAHCCWTNAKMIAVCEWAKAMQTRARATGRSILLEERPSRGSVQVRDARTRELIATLEADASFPVDATGMAIQLITDGGPPF